MSPPSFSITVEEHALFPSFSDDLVFLDETWTVFPQTKEALEDHSTGRLAEMDKGHVSYQIMSHLPGLSNFNPEGTRKANNEMAEAIRKNPSRFGGFAALPMAFPREAAAELERAVKELRLFGAMIDSHLGDMTHYDSEKFWPVFEMAVILDVPIYIHPALPPEFVQKGLYSGNYSTVAAQGLATGGWGWHQDVGLHVLKLYSAGLFARYPRLKIIIGHMGELLPIMIDRVDSTPFFKQGVSEPFRDVWDRNIWVTAGGIFSVRTLEMVLKITKKDRILYSIDTPFGKSIDGWNYLQKLATDSSLSKEDLDMFAFGNAVKLFKLDMDLKKF
ncbi:amidohydrolase 2 [Daldinia caldariorum]|uniref:amidohydrolase 2 n=1 Tax=Daldinia caldariorum TaxID=326644 RepID=UPI002007BA0D|nr:amidohydrolase 2 [Daldinia caldariorum]KAI1472066.1 amidohydrolase 2 [Daldinia caldariorum]